MTPLTEADALIAFCESEIARRRKGRSVLDQTQDAFCHCLTDVIYAAMEGDWAEVQALMDELDYVPLYRVGALPSLVERRAA